MRPDARILAGWVPSDLEEGAPTPARLGAMARARGLPVVSLGPCWLIGGGASARDPAGVECLLAGRIVAGGDAQAVAAAQARRADAAAALACLRGEFVAVIWEPRPRRLVLARDQLGGRSLHIAAASGGLWFAEEVRDLLGLLAAQPAPDRASVALMLARGLVPAGRSLFEGIDRVEPGGLVELAPETRRSKHWWTPRYAGVDSGNADELAHRTVAAADRAIARCAGGERVAVMLSGGLDSSAVAAGAVRAAQDRDQLPVAYSGVFPEHPSIDETEKLDAVVDCLELRSVRREVTGGSALAGSLAYLDRWSLPVGSPNHFVWEPLFARAAADGLTTMLDGEGGDEVFDVSGYLIADSLRAARVRAAARQARDTVGAGPDAPASSVRRLLMHYGVKGALPQVVHRLRRRGESRQAPAWLNGPAAHAADEGYDPWEWKRLHGPLWWRHQVFLLTRIRELLDAHGYARRRAWQVGVDSRHPFMHDVDLIETVLRLPPEQRYDYRLDRVLLRRGLAGRLPPAVLECRDKRRFDALLQGSLDSGDSAVLRELLEDPHAEVRSWLDPEVLRAEILSVDATSAPRGAAAWRAAIWRLGLLECWLRALIEDGFTAKLGERLELAPVTISVRER